MRRVLLALALLTATHAIAQTQQVRAWRVAHEQAILDELRAFLAIPNIASDTPNIERNASALAEMLRRRGVEPKLLRVEGAPPVVFGEIRTKDAKETLVLYAHYDGQPVDPAKWDSDPFTPAMRGDRLYARSASDDKAPIIAMLAALDALRASKIPLRINVKFIFEGEEEAGSPHLGAILERHHDLVKDAQLWIIADGPEHQSGRAQLYFGVRGVLGLELTTYGPGRPLHSGHYGNWAPNPITTLANLIASMRDDDGRILIDDFYDDVRPLTEAERNALKDVPPVDEALRRELDLGRTEGDAPVAERITQPALNLRGIRGGNVGAQSANVISTEAMASIDFRLVPDQTPESVREKVERHLSRRGFYIVHETPDAGTRRAHANVIKVEWESGYPASRVALDHPLANKVAQRIEAASGTKLIRLPTLGGSVPLSKLGAPALGVPTVNYDNNQHGANENLRLQNLWNAIETFAAILAGR
ncbi:MAG TPA: M20/M25/M40 family metallo-hydrolase [Thermoanaerobaculia bacterium]|nr:M20/M25/M40 family metallo-hydrolase [Thermoanaerobaculia bacterium]